MLYVNITITLPLFQIPDFVDWQYLSNVISSLSIVDDNIISQWLRVYAWVLSTIFGMTDNLFENVGIWIVHF